MSPFTKIAWRNITRNKWRSALTIAAVSTGLGALIFLKGFVDGADRQMVENYTDLLTGHIQVHRAGFQKNMGLEKSIVHAEVLSTIFREISGIAAYASRIKDHALVSSAEGSSGVLLMGVDPEAEKTVSTIHRRVRQGAFLKKGEDHKILIGRILAENLKVALSDKVVVMTQASDGSMAAAAYEICGILEAGAEEIDGHLALISLDAARDLLVMGNRVSEVVVKADSLERIDKITEALRGRADLKRFEVLTWKDISPMTYQWLQFDQVFTALILFVVLIVAASGVLNTVLMGVLERTREFGIMLALGTKPAQISNMVAMESFFLGFIGAVIGTIAGAGLVFISGIKGIDLSVISSALNSFYIGSVVYPRLDVLSVVFYASVVLLTTLFVSVIPARKAARLTPIEAIRHI